MRFPVKPVPVLAGLVALALSAPLDGARTAEWTRGTVGGGQVSRSVSGDGPFYTGHTTRVGPNGGTYSSTATCFDGIRPLSPQLHGDGAGRPHLFRRTCRGARAVSRPVHRPHHGAERRCRGRWPPALEVRRRGVEPDA